MRLPRLTPQRVISRMELRRRRRRQPVTRGGLVNPPAESSEWDLCGDN